MNIRNEYVAFSVSMVFLIAIFYGVGLIKFTYSKSHVEIDFSSPIFYLRHEPTHSRLFGSRNGYPSQHIFD